MFCGDFADTAPCEGTMQNYLFKLFFIAAALVVEGCKPAPSSAGAIVNALDSGSTIVGIVSKSEAPINLSQVSKRSLRTGVICRLGGGAEAAQLSIVPSTLAKISSVNGLEYFIQLKTPLSSSQCQVAAADEAFDYRSFFVSKAEVDLLTSTTVSPEQSRGLPPDLDSLKSNRAEALARDIENRRSGGNKPCGLTSFGNRGCWACVGWSMTSAKVFPPGLGAVADASPNGFLRATASARSRKAADGTVNIKGVRFLSLKAQYGSTPSLAPRGSILFCNTSTEGHAAIITNPANEMRSDVIEIIGANWRQSLCWERVDEILFPLD
jgi:hypothetical protein